MFGAAWDIVILIFNIPGSFLAEARLSPQDLVAIQMKQNLYHKLHSVQQLQQLRWHMPDKKNSLQDFC